MLVIRMQRTGRKGHAQFRVVVQDSRRTPTSGRVVAALGHFNPHTKQVVLDKEKTETYIKNGAQPSERVARLLKAEGVKLPDWVKISEAKTRTTRNVEKLRKNRPAEEVVEEPTVPEATEEVAVETPEAEAPAEEAPAVEASDEEKTEE
jgi:small subunit ribosomal protein S16